jgi:photosystem II stability/assembly factor-like uncharacterized protein
MTLCAFNRSSPLPVVIVLALGAALPLPLSAQGGGGDPNVVYHPALLQGFEYRSVGPHRGGRVTAVAGVPERPHLFYMGGTGSGVWKTTNAGESWVNISDGYFHAGSIGAIAVADGDPNVMYVGTGSACVRGNVSTGIGMYRSTDAGRTWEHIGLPDAGQIGRVRIHPRDPDVVYVAALGHIFGPNPERGVYRSRDGGGTWEKVLFVSDSTGAVDLAMDVTNPRVLYAAMWRAERRPWTLISGAREGGVYKTTDGGDTWTKLTNGLPEGLVGRIGVAVSPANPQRVWALVEAQEGEGLYRSDDGGATFRPVNLHQKMIMARPWYYTHITADPSDENTVYINNERLWKSVDGGEAFERIPTPHGDNHDIWVNPRSPSIMINANDGGGNISLDGGRSWSTQLNQPTAEFYFVTVDNQFPYRIYGPQQDNSTITIPSRSIGGLTPYESWYAVGGCETGPIALDPDRPDVVYAGCYGGRVTRFDRRTGQARQVADWPHLQHGRAAAELKYRFQWNAPIVVSRHDPNVIYHASQYVHRSTNEGQSWEVISPDLTRNDPRTQQHAGEPITWDITGVEIYPTIFALVESSTEPDVLWAGSNDGLVHVSRDRGMTWNDVTPSDLPEFSTVNRIEVSSHGPGRAFIAAYRYRLDDFAPYIFRTDDHGRSWRRITDGKNGIPANHPVRVVREDPNRRGLLYAGTEFGMFISFNDGAQWQSLQFNLPHVPVTDLAIHNEDLIVATQGRSFWILDDVTPLHQLDTQVAGASTHLFEPRATYRVRTGRRRGGDRTGTPAPNGTLISYYLEEPQSEMTLEILDASGSLIRRYSSDGVDGDGPALPNGAGMHRFVWDLRYAGADIAPDGYSSPNRDIIWGDVDGPMAVPGSYQARLGVGDWSATKSFELLKDPRINTTLADLREQFDFMMRVRDKITEAQDAIREIRAVRGQVARAAERMADADPNLVPLAETISKKLTAVEEELMELRDGDVAKLRPRLSSEFAWLNRTAASADARPTDQLKARFDELAALLAGHLRELRRVLDTDVAAFNRMVAEE